MSLLAKTRAAFAVVFLSVLFCLFAWNMPRFAESAKTLGLPHSAQDFREACTALQGLAREYFAGKYAAWEAHAALQEALGKSEVNDFAVVKAANGRLYRGGLYPLTVDNARELADDIADFAEAAGEQGARVLYLNMPDCVLKNAPPGPPGLPYLDFNPAADALLYVLRERGVPSLDTRYAFIRDGFPPEAISPKTSGLLSGRAAFAVFGYLLDGLERHFDLSLDPEGVYRNPEHYVLRDYPDSFIGEWGKNSGPAFSGLDDFTAVSPGFDTDIEYESIDMFDTFTRAEGDIRETLLNPDALVYYDNLYRFYPQSYYRHTNTAWSTIKNLRNPDGPKLLFIHDDYPGQVITHLVPLFSEIHTLAWQENFSANATQYLQDNAVEYVVIAFEPENLLNPRMRLLIGNAPKP